MHDHITAAELREGFASGIVGGIIADDYGGFRATRARGDSLGHRELQRTDRQ
jgi:hypothetical protein